MTSPSIILDIEPDWTTDPAVTYSFLSSLQDTPYFVEQRRPLLVDPVRTVNYRFVNNDETFQRLSNTLLAAVGEQLCVPIFSEPIVSVSIVLGGSAVTATTDLSTLWNINNCSYVVLLDVVTGQSEMIGVASVVGQVIHFSTNITKSWTAAQTVIYPAIAASLSSFKEAAITDSVGSVEAEFEEIILGAEATEDWVGLEDRICCERGDIIEYVPNGEWDGTYFSPSSYTLSSTSLTAANNYTSVIQFELPLPRGWRVASAKIGWTYNGWFGYVGQIVTIRYYAALVPDGGMPYAGAALFALPVTSAYAIESGVVDSRSPGVYVESPELKDVVNEVLDQAEWAAYNKIVFLIKGYSESAANGWYFYSYDYSSGTKRPRLLISY